MANRFPWRSPGPSRSGRTRRAVLLAASSAFLVMAAALQPAAAQDPPIQPATASGPDAQRLQPLVDRMAGRVMQRFGTNGMIVGVSWQGRRSYFGFAAPGGTAFDADTIVEIGSVTKVFTTALLAEAIAEGRIQADDNLQSLMPRRSFAPCTGQMTALQLADFSSGMPDEPGNLPRRLAERGIDHYTSEDFLNWVSRWSEDTGEGCNLPAPYRYSNASVGLLGYILADRLGEGWEELVRRRITDPLGMTSTHMRVPPEQQGRLAQGYGTEGNAVIPWPVFAWYAAGALRSSASDMLAFGEAALGHEAINGGTTPPALIAGLRTAMTPVYEPEGRLFGQGMAWIEHPGDEEEGTRPVYLKDGGTDGFNSVIVINPAKDLAVFISANRADSGIPRLGVALSRHIR